MSGSKSLSDYDRFIDELGHLPVDGKLAAGSGLDFSGHSDSPTTTDRSRTRTPVPHPHGELVCRNTESAVGQDRPPGLLDLGC